VQFHRPGKTGKFVGNGRVVTRGRDICHLAGELRQDGKIVATATATATIRKL
jgi:acyl-coenzyme A thioesterase PaaI-like protein